MSTNFCNSVQQVPVKPVLPQSACNELHRHGAEKQWLMPTRNFDQNSLVKQLAAMPNASARITSNPGILRSLFYEVIAYSLNNYHKKGVGFRLCQVWRHRADCVEPYNAFHMTQKCSPELTSNFKTAYLSRDASSDEDFYPMYHVVIGAGDFCASAGKAI